MIVSLSCRVHRVIARIVGAACLDDVLSFPVWIADGVGVGGISSSILKQAPTLVNVSGRLSSAADVHLERTIALLENVGAWMPTYGLAAAASPPA